MTLIDRYLTWMFLKIFLVCFISFTGLFVIVHLFSNLDELTALSKGRGWGPLAWDFYGPRIAELFDKTAAVWTLLAAVFAASLMQRRRELTAIEAAGVTKSRILRPIAFLAVIIVGLGIANRELLIPKVKDRLVRTPQNWADQEALPMGVYLDLNTGVKIRGKELSISDNKITDVEVQLPPMGERETVYLHAESATCEEMTSQRPAGLLLHRVETTEGIRESTLDSDSQSPMVLWPDELAELQPDQCFLAIEFDAYQAAYGHKLEEYHSTPEMLQELRKPRTWFGTDMQVNIHARFMRPILEMTLLMLGLPMAIKRFDKNIFISAGICFLVVGAMQLSIIASHSLGSYSLIEPAALAAWLPVIVFLPMGIVSLWQINR